MSIPVQVAALESEKGVKGLSREDLEQRRKLTEFMLSLPTEFFSRLRHLQPQVGCFNRCSFCSQQAGNRVWELDDRALRNVIAALKSAALTMAVTTGRLTDHAARLTRSGKFSSAFRMPEHGLVGYSRKEQRPGVIYCYLDNDISSYPLLDRYLRYCKEDLGVSTRISTVGYSRRNRQLQQMHECINRELLESLAGVRLSVTPYTLGWTGSAERQGVTSRHDFVQDMANYLRTYRPAVNYLGPGQRRASVEFRFRPLVVESSFEEGFVGNRHTILCGPYMLVQHEDAVGASRSISGTDWEAAHGRQGPLYQLFRDHRVATLPLADATRRCVAARSGERQLVRLWTVRGAAGNFYHLEAVAGPYASKQLYPLGVRDGFRGYIDSERYFLRALVRVKAERGLSRTQEMPGATWQDADRVLTGLLTRASFLDTRDAQAASHIRGEIYPLAEAVRNALECAGYPASFFFSPRFLIDTGTICNLGGAVTEFGKLARRPNLPITLDHERAYGTNSGLAREGRVWRLTVGPRALTQSARGPRGAAGTRNEPYTDSVIVVEELDLAATATDEGQLVSRRIATVHGVREVTWTKREHTYLIPGEREARPRGNERLSRSS